MSIKNKITLIIFVSNTILAALVILISSTFLINSYSALENENIQKDLSRAKVATVHSLEQLQTSLLDWSHWDDTYFFVQDNNQEYINTNLIDSSLINIGLNYILYLNANNEIVYSKYINDDGQATVNTDHLNSEILSYEQLTQPNNTEDFVSGIIKIEDRLLIISSNQILDSNEQLPSAGFLIFGQLIDDHEIEEIRDITQLSFELYLYDDDQLPPDVKTAKEGLMQTSDYFTSKNSQEISIYGIIHDINKAPVGIIKITESRDIYKNGIKTIIIFTLTSLVTTIILSIIINYVSNKFLVSRFLLLTEQIEKIKSSHDLSIRIDEGQSDEIGRFAATFNELLDGLAISRANETKLKEKDISTNKKLKERIREIESFNKIMINRELRIIKLKEKIKELEKHNTPKK